MTRLKITTFLMLLALPFLSNAQIPTEVPKPQDNSPLDFSDPFEIIMFFILPIVFVVLFFVWRSKKKRDAEEKNLKQ